MTTLALDPSDHFVPRLWGKEENGAGPLAQSLSRSLREERQRLSGDAEGLKYTFDDLDGLASEYGIAPHNPVLALGRAFLMALPADISAPWIDLDQEGDLVFDWRGPCGALLTVCMAPDGHLNFASRFSDRQSRTGQDIFDDSIPTDLIRLARKVINARQPAA